MSRTMRTLFIRAVACLCVCSATLHAQTKRVAQLSIADTTGKKGDTLLVPIRISTLATADSVYSGQFTISYNNNVISIYGIDTTGTLLRGYGSVTFNATTGSVGFAGTSILTGSGIPLLYFKTVLMGNPADLTTISFVSALLNEGNQDSVTTTSGRVRILAIQISPKTPSSTLVVGDSLQFSVSGDQKPPLTWSSSDTTIGRIDANGKLRTLSAGQLRIRVGDSQNLQDSTNIFGIYPSQARSLTVTTRDTSYTQTLLFNLPIYISDVTGLRILSSQLSLTYNSSMLQAVGIVTANTKTSNWSSPTFNATSGRVDIALAGTDTLTGGGILLYVRFKVLPAASGQTTITFSSVLFNENLNANTVDGRFTALTAPTVVISPTSATLTKGDTLRFRVTSGGRAPFTWTSSSPSVASIDTAGLLRALTRGTTTVGVVDSFGFSGSTSPIIVNDFRITLPDTAMGLADSIDVPIFADDLSGLNILSFESRIVYDSTIVRVSSVLNAGTMSNGFSISYKDTLDTLRIAGAGSAQLSGGGTLLKVRLKTRSSSTGVTSPLTFAYFRFNEGSPTASTRNGSIAIVAAPAAPTLASPADSATGISTSPTLVWNSSTGATSYRVQISTVNDFTTSVVDSSGITGTSLNISGLGVNITYFWRVSARNVAASSAFSATRQFTTFPGSAPTTPTLASPADSATGVSTNPTLSWNASAGASTYRLQLSISLSFSTTVVDSQGITATSLAVSGLANNTTFFWRVSATNAGGTSAFTATRRFTTIVALPSVPILASPANNATGVARNPRLTWNRSFNAASYQVQLSTSSTFSTTVVDSSNVTDTTVVLPGLAANTVHYWRVNAKNAAGTSGFSSSQSFTTGTQTSVSSDRNKLPTEYRLEQNFPNPFNPSTSIDFSLPTQSFVRLTVYNIVGNEITTLVSKELDAGQHRVQWNAAQLSSGVYLYTLTLFPTSGSQEKVLSYTRKMVLLK